MENSSHIDVIAKNILTQVDLLTNGKFPDNNILFDSNAENIEYGVADNLVQADITAQKMKIMVKVTARFWLN